MLTKDNLLVVYNVDNSDSVEWADFYCEHHGIPKGNTAGMVATSREVHPQKHWKTLYDDVRRFLNTNSRLRGIVFGYRFPRLYGWGPGKPKRGLPINTAFQGISEDMSVPWRRIYDDVHNEGLYYDPTTFPINPAHYRADHAPQPQYPTIPDHCYVTAEIDAPTLADAKRMTTGTINTRWGMWIDYKSGTDEWAEGRWCWEELRKRGAHVRQFELATDGMPHASFVAQYYKLTGWDSEDIEYPMSLGGGIAYPMNSLGAMTVRSTTADGGLAVPNCITNGYVAAIGATTEPGRANCPNPTTIVDGFFYQKMTLGEAFFYSLPRLNFAWTLCGDPLRRLE